MKTQITKEQAEECALRTGWTFNQTTQRFSKRPFAVFAVTGDELINIVSIKSNFLPIVECARQRGWLLLTNSLYIQFYKPNSLSTEPLTDEFLVKVQLVKDHGYMNALILAFISIPNWERRVEHRRKGLAIGNGDTQKPCKRDSGRDSDRRNPLHKYKGEDNPCT